MKSWYITESLAAESLTKYTIFWHLANQEMLKLIRVSKHLDILFRSTFYLLNKKNRNKKEVYTKKIQKYTGRAHHWHLLSAEELNAAFTPESWKKHLKNPLRKIKDKSSQSLHFGIFMFQITFTISVSK